MSTDLARFEGKALEHAQRALEFEEDAARYPEEAGECLLEASANWQWAGDIDRAAKALATVIERGGEDAQYGRSAMASLLFDTGDSEGAYSQLAALRAMKPLDPGPCHMTAELLEERGDLVEALAWFNIATTRLREGELERAVEERPSWSYAGDLLAGRKRVRRALGMPPDDLDDAVVALPRLRAHPLDATPVLYWPRSEHTRAVLADPADYFRELEATIRDLAGQGVPRIVLVPATVDGLAAYAADTGGSADDPAIRTAYAEVLLDRGLGATWPPARNGPCWCGSGAKYKKCCGSPAGR